MPELPDVELYRDALERFAGGQRLERIRLRSPFLLRSVDPPLEAAFGRRLRSVERLGKRLVLGLEDELFLVLHLMVTGRLRWRPPGAGIPGRRGLAALDFEPGTLLVTEMGTKRRASLVLVASRSALQELDPGGLEVLDAPADRFAAALTAARHTLKRALTDPRILSGIGNAYSDEILHRAGLSPFKLTTSLTESEMADLHAATLGVLVEWRDRLRAELGDRFPEKVTAFRPDMAVHGRFGEPCPRCQSPVQRIVYAENEANYCPVCQTGGKLLADRALSRLLRGDWPRTLEELELLKARSARP